MNQQELRLKCVEISSRNATGYLTIVTNAEELFQYICKGNSASHEKEKEPNKFDQVMQLMEGMTHEAAESMLNLALSQIGFAATVQKY